MIANRFRRALDALVGRSAGYEGAGTGRRWRGAGEIPNLSVASTAARGALASRARALVANNAAAAAGVEAWTSALVGTGIRPTPTHPNPAWRAAASASWDRWTDEADLAAELDFYGIEALIARRTVVDGDSFVGLVHDELGRLRLRTIEADQLDANQTRELPTGGRIISGVEFDAAGRRVAFHIYRRPRYILGGLHLATIRVPGEDLLQVFRPDTPGQPRGVSWFAPVLLRLRDTDETRDAMIMRAKVAAALAGFVTTDANGAAGFDGAPVNGVVEGGIEPGTLKALDPGQNISFSEPARIGAEVIDFLKVTAKEIAAGLGVPASALTGDYSDANYSSLRSEKVAFQRRVEAVQHNVFVFQLLRPIWRRWLTTEIISGRLPAPDFERNPEIYLGSRWITPRETWVDPAKDVDAEIAAINAGLLSRRQAVEARGIAIEDLDAEIAADRAREAALGLTFGKPPTEPEAA